MLINRQTITVTCDLCGFEIILYDEVIPKNGSYLIPHKPDYWIEINSALICGRHPDATMKIGGGEIKIEDSSGRRLSLKS